MARRQYEIKELLMTPVEGDMDVADSVREIEENKSEKESNKGDVGEVEKDVEVEEAKEESKENKQKSKSEDDGDEDEVVIERRRENPLLQRGDERRRIP